MRDRVPLIEGVSMTHALTRLELVIPASTAASHGCRGATQPQQVIHVNTRLGQQR
jgi:hypothetical protein